MNKRTLTGRWETNCQAGGHVSSQVDVAAADEDRTDAHTEGGARLSRGSLSPGRTDRQTDGQTGPR